jgi:hypothetical protein
MPAKFQGLKTRECPVHGKQYVDACRYCNPTSKRARGSVGLGDIIKHAPPELKPVLTDPALRESFTRVSREKNQAYLQDILNTEPPEHIKQILREAGLTVEDVRNSARNLINEDGTFRNSNENNS